MKENGAIEFTDFVAKWQGEFINEVKRKSGSKKQVFKYEDAVRLSENYSDELDKLMIRYLDFINSDPLKSNDYFKFVSSYQKGKRLNEKYFRNDIDKLHEYYKKSDSNKEYNPFNRQQFERYVLFMMLKLSGHYSPEYDAMFHVKIDKHREYNPLTSIPSVLRHLLPFKIQEYDISQAYPNFVFLELGIDPFDVYSVIDKRSFNTLLNTHKGNKGATIDKVRAKLKPVYGNRVNEVITDERFNNKGKVFEQFAKYESEFIAKFIEANELKNCVRLHDGVVTKYGSDCKVLSFGNIKFKVKGIDKPETKNEIVSFYDDEQKTSPVSYSKFWEQENFIRITREGHDQLTILKNDNRIVSPINHKTDLVPYLKANINEYDPTILEDRIARDATSTIQQSLQLLTPIRLQYHKDTKDRCDIPFKNGIARITTDGTELIPYDEIDGFFAKHSTQEHEISISDADEDPGEFCKFLSMAVTNKNILEGEKTTEKDESDFQAFCSMFGYLITNYKNPAFNPAIILSDANADGETRNGGRGKSLLQMALSQFRPSIQKGGKAYDPDYTHVHADLKPEHDLYLIDDVPSRFDYNALFTNMTGGIDAQRKGVTAETIPFEDAPKFVISTNWAVRYDEAATSTNRRFKEYKFSNYWNIHNTPDKVFGRSFFNDWDHDEWNRFFNFGFSCVQHYLNYGLQTIEYDKKGDNFRAQFYHDAILQEAERIFDLLTGQDFTVTDFVNHHQSNDTFRYKPEFNIRNARNYIDAFIEFKKLPYRYEQKTRKWKCYP